jgi:translocation and assembly module TamB
MARRQRTDEILDESQRDDAPVRPRRKRSWLALGLLFLLVAALLAPTFIANSSLLNSFIAKVVPPQAGRVTIGQASLGWLSPPRLGKIEVTDAAGAPILSAEAIEVQSSLWSLIWNRDAIGPVRIVRPVVNVLLKPSGTNLEEFAQAIEGAKPQAAGEPSGDGGTPVQNLNIELVDGVVNLIDALTNERWRAVQLNALMAKRGDDLDQFGLSARGALERLDASGAPTPAGNFALELSPVANGRRMAKLDASGLPLAVANMWLRRAQAPVMLQGVVSASGTAAWNAAPALEALPSATPPNAITQLLQRGLETSGQANIANLQLLSMATGPAPIRRANVQLPWKLRTVGDRLLIDTLRLTSEVGQVNVTGGASAAELSAATKGDPLSLAGVQLDGQVELAKLAAFAPTLIQMRADTQINSGVAKFRVANRPVEGGRQLAVRLETTPIRAVSAGQPIEWDVPLTIDGSASQRGGVWAVDNLSCVSEFLQATGSGEPNDLTITANLDLNKLAGQLGKFIDLGQWQLAGVGNAKVRYRQPAAGRFELSSLGELNQVLVGYQNAPLAAEEKLNFTASASGVIDPVTQRPGLVEKGELGVTAGADQLTAKLSEPMALGKHNAPWPVEVALTGDLNSWRRRLALTPVGAKLPPDLAVGGALQLAAKGRVAPKRGELTISKCDVTNLVVDTANLRIRESQFQASGDWRWDLKKGVIESTQGQIVSGTIALRSRNVALALDELSATSTGELALRADLARLAACRVSNPPARYQPQGQLVGTMKISKQSGAIVGELNLSAEPVALLDLASARPNVPPQQVWQEPKLTITGAVVYDQGADRLELRNIKTESNALRSQLAGEIRSLSTRGDTRITGAVDYDLAQLSPLLWPYVGGPNIKLVGRDQAKFELTGALHAPAGAAPLHWSRTLRGTLEAPWTQANVFGLAIGSGRIAAKLGDGVIDFEPLEFTAGEGKIAVKPLVKLDPPPQLLTHPPGTLVSRVTISQEVTQQFLKFIAPVMADATRIDGGFSLNLSEAIAPLENPRAGKATGQLLVHSVRVQPGPMVAEWTNLARQIEGLVKAGNAQATIDRGPPTLLSIRDQTVNFKLENGRVYHQALQFDIGNVAVTTSGSVGLDETLELVLAIPINPEWLVSRPVLAGAFAGKTIQIPIRGTFAQPQISRDMFEQLSKDFVEGALQGGLNGLFERLRGGR